MLKLTFPEDEKSKNPGWIGWVSGSWDWHVCWGQHQQGKASKNFLWKAARQGKFIIHSLECLYIRYHLTMVTDGTEKVSFMTFSYLKKPPTH